MSREGERGNECDGGGKARWTKILHVAGCLYLCLCAVAVSTLTSASSSFINPYLVSSEQGPRLQLPAQQLEDRQTQQEAVHPPVGQQWQAGQLGHLGQIERHINVQRKHLLRLAKRHHLSTPGCLAEWLLLVLMLTVDLLSMGSLGPEASAPDYQGPPPATSPATLTLASVPVDEGKSRLLTSGTPKSSTASWIVTLLSLPLPHDLNLLLASAAVAVLHYTQLPLCSLCIPQKILRLCAALARSSNSFQGSNFGSNHAWRCGFGCWSCAGSSPSLCRTQTLLKAAKFSSLLQRPETCQAVSSSQTHFWHYWKDPCWRLSGWYHALKLNYWPQELCWTPKTWPLL